MFEYFNRRFSLRAIFVATAVCAVVAMAMSYRVHDRRRTLSHILQAGGTYTLGKYSKAHDLDWVSESIFGVEAMRPVRGVNLGGSRDVNPIVAQVVKLPRLQFLILDDSDVSAEGLLHLHHARRLAQLDLANCQVKDADLLFIAAATNVVHLDLSGTNVTDDGMKHLAGLHGLHSLDLSHTPITSRGVAELSRLTRLNTLGLRGTRVDDAMILELRTLPSLSVLDLDHATVSDDDLAGIASLPHLSTLYLKDVGLSRQTIDAIERLRPFLQIDCGESAMPER